MITFEKVMAILMAGAALLGGQAEAQQSAPAIRVVTTPSLDAAFDAAALGDVAPLMRALDQAEEVDLRSLIQARLGLARRDPEAHRDPAVARMAAAGDGERRRAALGILTLGAFAQDDHAEAARAGRLYAEALAEAGNTALIGDAERGWRIAALLADQPRQRVEGSIAEGSTERRTDRVGLPRVDVAINGQTQDAVFDTGAALSVLSTETARRLGVTILDAEAAVENGVAGTVPVRVGVADRLEIAGVTLRNVAFLIIDDSQLTFPLPGGYDIKAIIGMPVMRALGRFRMDTARLTVLPASPEGRGTPNLRASGNSLFIDVAVDGRPVPLLLDTGANQTALTAIYAQAVPAALSGLENGTSASASAGGSRQQRIATWRNAPVALADRSLTLPALPIALPGGEGPTERRYGLLGSDVLRRFASYTIDLRAMRLELGEPLIVASR